MNSLLMLLIASIVANAYERHVMDIPEDVYNYASSSQCVRPINLTLCVDKRRELVYSVKIHSKHSEVVNAECCLYREYLDCVDDQLQESGCVKDVYREFLFHIYDHLYNFDTKCYGYERYSWNVIWFCLWPWWVWTIIVIGINVAILLFAYWIIIKILSRRAALVSD